MAAGEPRARKRQRTSQNGNADADDGKKQRGRPRVEGQDETAADVCLPEISTLAYLVLPRTWDWYRAYS
jgi:hypothetical protein